MDKEDVLIIGAGPTGMAAAFELHKANTSTTVIEKDDQIGGLAKTFQFGDFRTDIGPHRFFSKNKYLYDLIKDLLGERWIKVDRLTSFCIDGKFFRYPIEMRNALINVGLFKAFRILFDNLFEKIKKKFIKKDLLSFEDYVVSHFGRSLAELNLLNYTEKVWGLPCSEISSDWATQRIKGLSLKEVVKKTFINSNTGPKTLADRFYYPDLGTGLIYEKTKERVLTRRNSVIRVNSYPVKIVHNDDNITEVVINADGKNKIIKPKYVICSIPISELIGLLYPKVPSEILRAVKKLKFRSHVSLFITLDKSSVFPDQWIYFPDKKIPFGRITEPKNFSKKMSPLDKTSLLVEFFCWENDKIWNASKEELFKLTIKWLEKLGFIKREEVIDIFVHKEKYAYPVYDLTYKNYLQKIKNYLNRFDNLLCVGRACSFKYNNQDHALEMGILAARSIINGKKYDIESCGSEKEYFEKGYIK